MQTAESTTTFPYVYAFLVLLEIHLQAVTDQLQLLGQLKSSNLAIPHLVELMQSVQKIVELHLVNAFETTLEILMWSASQSVLLMQSVLEIRPALISTVWIHVLVFVVPLPPVLLPIMFLPASVILDIQEMPFLHVKG